MCVMRAPELLLLLLVLLHGSGHAFLSTPPHRSRPSSATRLLAGEDPMLNAADLTIKNLKETLAPGVPAPPELDELVAARESGKGTEALAASVYNLMCEQACLFDRDENGKFIPTRFDLSSDFDDPEVKQKIAYTYQYGINMITAGIINQDDVMEAAKDRLISRVGKTPEEFDAWLGY